MPEVGEAVGCADGSGNDEGSGCVVGEDDGAGVSVGISAGVGEGVGVGGAALLERQDRRRQAQVSS